MLTMKIRFPSMNVTDCESARCLLLFYIAYLFIIIMKPYDYLMR